MRNLLNATLPALALLALGGCATSGALTSTTETDGVYYSSKDRTTANSPYSNVTGAAGSGYATAPASTDAPAADNANPDYQGGSTQQATANGTDYYDNSYTSGSYNASGFGQPYSGPGVSSYNYSPSWSVSPSFYGSPFGYGAGLSLAYGYSPFSYGYGGFGGYPYYGGFYDPFFSPFGYGYGSGLSLGLGFGYGFGGFGYPYGYGYSPFYGGYGGYGLGYYGGGYGRPGYATEGVGNNALYSGNRNSRGGSIMNGARPAGIANGVDAGNGRRANTGTYVPSGGLVASPNTATYAPGTTVAPTRRDGGAGGNIVGQPTYSTPGGGGQVNATGQPQNATNGRRGGFFSGFFGNGTPAGGNGATNANNGAYPAGANQGQMQRRSSYSQQAQNNGFAQPQQRTYSQPQQRTYSEPSFNQSQRSFGGGNFGGGGGGSFGGGGGGGGGGRRGGR
ncbi:hypothetical protein [Hymenobacter ginkgonis]|uniref:hypothetical protein n=1 Tax=Hymenobacter ginkgonis TaxID=2682976 RepID=UPI0018DBC107|nr:hypothetical protein [Hymenobacter ginkgonis]